MKPLQFSLLLFLFLSAMCGYGQEETDEYLEFNDRNNVVHGVYVGIHMGLGEVENERAYLGGLKIAYVANQQFEVGFAANFLYSEQDIFNNTLSRYEDLIAGYGGLHLEPILFSKKRINLSFPLLLGAGAVGYVDAKYRDDDNFEEELTEDDFDEVFVAEPGINALFNISRYLQLEAGVKYRFSSKIELPPTRISRINGFSAGIGIKVGIFNMGRNRYKKNVQ
ncbi:hypothetical protein SAMN05192545_1526 [Maribacter dokdonensis]|uniref:Outer membrane protein beta-barrel domain-containing protein n=1 Tax=Maribacter dokdonensis TaxID=320912 RepID=A0ABY0UDV7_9FLAO|nr:hypothetical protein [Maribacter dokdonensis]SDS50854.1 hypothetical protein SAMN05192545_1526 [Maribacter dokdonensis]